MKCQRCENGTALYEETDKVLGYVHKCTSCGWRHFENEPGKPKRKLQEIQESKPVSKKYNFIQIRRNVLKPAFITIWKSGRMCLNAATLMKHNSNNLEYALLFYDKNKRSFGIRFSEKSNDAFQLIKHLQDGGERRIIDTRATLKYLGIEIEKPIKMPVKENKELDLLVIELK